MLAILDPRREGSVKYSTSVFRFVCFISGVLVEIFWFSLHDVMVSCGLKKSSQNGSKWEFSTFLRKRRLEQTLSSFLTIIIQQCFLFSLPDLFARKYSNIWPKSTQNKLQIRFFRIYQTYEILSMKFFSFFTWSYSIIQTLNELFFWGKNFLDQNGPKIKLIFWDSSCKGHFPHRQQWRHINGAPDVALVSSCSRLVEFHTLL